MKIDPHGGGPLAVPAQGQTFHRFAHKAAEAGALIGALFLLVMTGTTVYSVVGRVLFNAPLYGNYEIVELCSAIAIFSFFPYTHIQRANVVASFFTDSLPSQIKALLDWVADVIFLAISILLFWRVMTGLEETLSSTGETMVLGIPEWVFFLPTTLWLGLLVLVCASMVASGALRMAK